ncbi:undecaprenyldiphospho-muramoylpentapeptide beta-N-acetylglucosaminyltransferase [Novosphingobium resinovorum]|uniref:undecaprenyldiphospho-muramoylpentapeptide beta-N-acetylglucosaminyltransferase n=1 Tax=Sphingomonadaceae TaxID=41297 RepID=UPI00027CC7A4|nr:MULTISPECIES: undecaprenyldiphospho-muramoylpentapeptide beta-N-acetylglucosaminyltransferase [Sphingomonadaceae]EJU12489.1 undecaprenyldiphospho-muramoylpentapeptide beta-N- acetylglucosaminyltransferase [Sphingomonas sp. LH128]MBF7012382.1 undecaprenyldiphospho-muramoylpentapeptide beta-N-acetylglucosaminyltransferase [Novosphingobium sp. HR1a]WJM27123.1 undecaprenyldiphospho-muramoylpentapeptide beta-N-acetylglucosaminyltransferase [Novosphingobium resinovorum]
MSSVSRHYVLAAGGTGGHLIPAFALAAELHARGHHVALVTDERGAAIPGKPAYLTTHVLPQGRIAGRNPLGWLKGAKGVLAGRRMALRLFESFEPTAVVGFGGYPAMPTMLAARAAKLPIVLHEQNSVLGRVNRWFAKKVDAIATSAEKTEKLDPALAGKVTVVGNPVREDVLRLREQPYPEFTEDSLFRILVTGGSQGARVLSDVVPEGLAMLPPALRSRLQVIQQARAEDIERVRERYAAHGIPAELATYFENMAERLAGAHLFIGRSGASTIAELTAVGRPAILIPLPYAMDDHQSVNAREMVAGGGARVIRQPAVTTENPDAYKGDKRNALLSEQAEVHQKMAKDLCLQIQAIAQHPETLANAAHASWNCGYPNAARDLADLVESFGAAPIMDVIRMEKASAPQGGEALAMENMK